MKNFFVIASFLLFSGCAFSVDKIDVPYQGRANITVVEGAENVSFQIAYEDKRTVYKDRVGTKKNGYGMECADIVATNDVAKTFAEAVAFELENIGFKSGESGKTVKVELVRFYNDFKIGFWSGSAVADGLINVVVYQADEEMLFTKSFEGGGIEEPIMIASGSNARAALVKAMADIVSKVVQDETLHAALLRTEEKAGTVADVKDDTAVAGVSAPAQSQ
ncbi:MAG: YajG family lipoprotein [Desulfovibrio sp.]